jgi:hypothetical protein
MVRAGFLLAVLLVPGTGLAQTTVCRATGFCNDSLTCAPDSNVLRVVRGAGNAVTLSWNDSTTFPGEIVQQDGTEIIVDVSAEGTIFTLIIGENGEGFASTSTDLGDDVESGVYVLNCRAGK